MKTEFNKVKIFVTVPKENLEAVRDAVCNAGAGVIGNYSYCTFSCVGEGTFIPNENANPHIGTNNNLEYVKEVKLEFICDVDKVKVVIEKLKATHPYEEPAIDIVPIIDIDYFK